MPRSIAQIFSLVQRENGQLGMGRLTNHAKTTEREKAMQVTGHFGVGYSLTITLPEGTTVGQFLRNPRVKAGLGHGDNVRAVIDGVPQPESAELSDQDEVHIETNVGTKAAQ